MATTHPTQIRTSNDHLDAHGAILLAAYAGGIVTTIAVATGAAALLASLTSGLGGFILVAGGWLVVVSASPEIAGRATRRLAELDAGQRAPRTSRAVTAVAAYLVSR